MTRKHTISRDELIDHIEAERWDRYASSATSGGAVKSLDFSTRRKFRVSIGGVVIYAGQSPTEAVNAYNNEASS